jgi:hypothetical protein
VTRLVVIDAVLLALVAAYVVWVAWIYRGSPVRKLFLEWGDMGRERWAGVAVAVVVAVGLLFDTGRYSLGILWVNLLVVLAATVAVRVGVQAIDNRIRARR